MIVDELGCFRSEIESFSVISFEEESQLQNGSSNPVTIRTETSHSAFKYPRTNTLTVVDGIKTESPGV